MAGFDDWGEGTSGAEHNDARLDHGRFTPLNPKTVTPEEHEQHVSNIEGQIRGASALERRAGARFYSRAHRDATRVGLGMAPGKQPYDNPVQRPGHTPLRKATPDQQARFHDPVQRDEAAKRGAGAIAALSPSSPAGMNWENNPTAAHEAWGLTTQHVAGLRHAVGMDRVAGQARGAVRSAKNSGIGLPEAKRAADRAETESKAASTTARADALGGVSSLHHAGNGAIIRAHEILSGEREPEDVLPMSVKTGHFYRAIRNPRDPSAAVIDGRSHDIALGTHMPWDTNRALGAKGRYQYFVDSHAEAADRTGVTPSQGQAISWIHDKNTMMAKSTPALRALGRAGNSTFNVRGSGE